MGILTWLGGAVLAFIAALLLDFGRFHPLAELFVAISGALTAGLVATWLDFGGYAEVDLRAFGFATLVAFLSIGLTRLAIAAQRWPSYRDESD